MNVVCITIDAWRASHASFAPAGPDGYTPNLDALADEGVVFTEAVSHGPATPYAFPALFSSTLPLDHGGYERIRPGRTLVSETLSEGGYRCVGVHANPWLGERNGYGRGYDEYRDVGEFGLPFAERARDLLLDRFPLDHPVYRGAQSLYRYAQRPLRALAGAGADEVSVARAAVQAGCERARQAEQAERAERIDRAERTERAADGGSGARSFTWMHLLEPHAPYTPPERHKRALGVESEGDATKLTTRAQRSPESLTERERESVRGLYGASVRHADERVGELLEVVPDDALVIVTADHGEALCEHGQIGHEPALFDELVRVPLLVRPPGGTGGKRVVNTQVRHVDLAPTILDYAGLAPPATYRGRSLRPAIEGETIEERIALSEVASHPSTPGRIDPDALQVSARRPDRKLLFADGALTGFDLQRDPRERDPIDDPKGAAWDDLRAVIDERRGAIEFGAPTGRERDEATERRLRALGYVE